MITVRNPTTLKDENVGLLLGLAMQTAVAIGGQLYFATAYRWRFGENFRGAEGPPEIFISIRFL